MNKLRLAVITLVIVALVVLQRLGVLESFADPARLKRAILELGAWGQLAFVVSYTLLQPIGVPGTVFVWASPLICPWPLAYALSMTGSMTASVVGFSLARFIGREWLADKLPERAQRYTAQLEQRAFTTVLVLRFLFWMPQWLHVFLGVSTVPFWTHFWGTLLGYAVPLLVVSLFGEALFVLARQAPPWVWIGLAIATLVLVAGVWFVARRRKLRED